MGLSLGAFEAVTVGASDGLSVGSTVGFLVGLGVVGAREGASDGADEKDGAVVFVTFTAPDTFRSKT